MALNFKWAHQQGISSQIVNMFYNFVAKKNFFRVAASQFNPNYVFFYQTMGNTNISNLLQIIHPATLLM